MVSGTSEWTLVMNRLEQLEKQNRRMKQIGMLVLILISSVFLMGQALPTRTIKANEFILTDVKGRTLAELATTKGNLEMPIMRFYGLEPLAPSGTVLRMTIGVVPDPKVVVYHAFGPLQHGNDELLSLGFSSNEPFFLLRSGRGNLSGVNTGGVLFDFTESGMPRLVLSGKDNKVLWKVP